MGAVLKCQDISTAEDFHKLYDACYESLAYNAVRITANSEAAEDIVQSVFVDLWERRGTLDDDTDMRSYLFMNVFNCSLDFLRHQNTENNYAEMLSQIAEGTVNPDDDNEPLKTEFYNQFFSAIDELSPRQREIFMMYMNGNNNHEIAKAMGIAEETVRVHKLRAIQSLKKRLGANEMLTRITSISKKLRIKA